MWRDRARLFDSGGVTSSPSPVTVEYFGSGYPCIGSGYEAAYGSDCSLGDTITPLSRDLSPSVDQYYDDIDYNYEDTDDDDDDILPPPPSPPPPPLGDTGSVYRNPRGQFDVDVARAINAYTEMDTRGRQRLSRGRTPVSGQHPVIVKRRTGQRYPVSGDTVNVGYRFLAPSLDVVVNRSDHVGGANEVKLLPPMPTPPSPPSSTTLDSVTTHNSHSRPLGSIINNRPKGRDTQLNCSDIPRVKARRTLAPLLMPSRAVVLRNTSSSTASTSTSPRPQYKADSVREYRVWKPSGSISAAEAAVSGAGVNNAWQRHVTPVHHVTLADGHVVRGEIAIVPASPPSVVIPQDDRVGLSGGHIVDRSNSATTRCECRSECVSPDLPTPYSLIRRSFLSGRRSFDRSESCCGQYNNMLLLIYRVLNTLCA